MPSQLEQTPEEILESATDLIQASDAYVVLGIVVNGPHAGTLRMMSNLSGDTLKGLFLEAINRIESKEAT